MIKTTKEQRKALKRKYDQSNAKRIDYSKNSDGFLIVTHTNYASYKHMRKSVHGHHNSEPRCVMLQWCNMWIGIETDGYTHS